jgi:MFS family permease
MAGSVGVALSAVSTPAALEAWGWRIPFLLGVAIIPIGLYIRRYIPEIFDQKATTIHPSIGRVFLSLLANHLRPVILALLVIMAGTISTYILSYMTTYAITTLRMPDRVSIAATLVVGLCTLIFSLVGGLLADRIGRKPIMIIPRIALIVLAYPAFLTTAEAPTPATLLLVTALLAMLNAISGPVSLVLIPESLPKSVRSTGVSVVYAVSVTMFGGTTQLVITGLIGATGNPLAPAWYMIGSSLIGAIAMLMITETQDTVLAK